MILKLKEHISIKKRNARDLVIKGINKDSLNRGDKIPVTFKSSFGTFNTYYIANYIKWISDNECMIQEKELNDSSIYLLPLITCKCTSDILKIPDRTYFSFNYFFINTYIVDDTTLGIVYRNIPSNSMSSLKERLNKYGKYKELDDNRFILFLFEDTEYLNTIKLFKEGKFKDISKEYTGLVLLFHGYTVDNIVIRILINDPKLRKEMSTKYGYTIPDECSLKSIPNLNKEMFNKNF